MEHADKPPSTDLEQMFLRKECADVLRFLEKNGARIDWGSPTNAGILLSLRKFVDQDIAADTASVIAAVQRLSAKDYAQMAAEDIRAIDATVGFISQCNERIYFEVDELTRQRMKNSMRSPLSVEDQRF